MDTATDFLRKLFDSSDFMPRWICGKWSEFHGWLYIFSNIAIGVAYFTIPILLLYFITKRKDVPLQRIFIWFILFILFCGTTHFADALMFWVPLYRINAVILLLTAIISLITVREIFKALPKALELKSAKQLHEIIEKQTSKLQEANQKISDSERQFKALVENNPDIITKIDKDLRFIFVNDAISKMSRYGKEKYLGKTPLEIFPDNDSSQFFTDKISEVFQTGKNVSYEFFSQIEEIHNKHFHIQIIPLFDGNEIEAVLTIAKNISDQKENEFRLKNTINNLDALAKRLEYKKRVLEDFTYIVSHNLRSPVGNLSSLVSLYQMEEDPEIKKMLIGKFQEVSEILSSTVNDLSEVVKIRQNTQIEREKLEFEEIIKDQIAGIYVKITESNALVTWDFSACKTIEYPKIYLESIILNLLTNAIKYSSKARKPTVHFNTSIDKNGFISLSCQDNGLGIDLKKYGHKIFNLHKTFHDHPDSKGVGLFITKNQVESLGGSIMVESEPNIGSKFIITFNDRV